ncbi:hypothetical protein GRJ2_000763100 [Grus japonensis]|uniref:Uncharacterized protein n=1 Tax=Grus japonensis TaxID=30415 RepID=A0ABC9WCP6_GRUJA
MRRRVGSSVRVKRGITPFKRKSLTSAFGKPSPVWLQRKPDRLRIHRSQQSHESINDTVLIMGRITYICGKTNVSKKCSMAFLKCREFHQTQTEFLQKMLVVQI